MPIPNRFVNIGDNVIASYNYDDIAGGLGIVAFYGAKSSSAYILTQNTIYSGNDTGGSRGLETAGNVDINFDTTTFNIPRTAKGNAYIVLPFSNTNTDTFHFTVQLKKILADLSTANISSAITQSITITGVRTDSFCTLTIPLTETLIKVGEKLRFNLIITRDGGQTTTIYHDPANRSSAHTNTSVMTFLMSFKIDA